MSSETGYSILLAERREVLKHAQEQLAKARTEGQRKARQRRVDEVQRDIDAIERKLSQKAGGAA